MTFKKRVNLGCPFGVVKGDPERMFVVQAFDEGEGEGKETPTWLQQVRQVGGRVLAGPFLDVWAWRAVVEFPSPDVGWGIPVAELLMGLPAEAVALAEDIANALPEVTQGEWLAWARTASKKGLDEAVRQAGQLAQAEGVRPAHQRAYRLIAEAVRDRLDTLRQLPEEELCDLLRAVGWWLRVKTLRGSLSPRGVEIGGLPPLEEEEEEEEFVEEEER